MISDVKNVVVRGSWDAYEAFDEAEWQETLRHQYAHIEQFHEYTKGDHSSDFCRRADRPQTTRHCKKFAEYEYPFVCSECGTDVGGRYKTQGEYPCL